jgi:hypothetical protein
MALTQVPIELSSTPGIVDNSNTTAITIDSSENVGIGTDLPVSTLELANNNQAAGSTLSITNSFNGADWNTNDLIGTIDFRTDDTSTSQPVRGSIKSIVENTAGATSPAYTALSFSTASVNTLAERMRIDSSGRVGIGTSSPSVPLEILNASSGIKLATPSAGNGTLTFDGLTYALTSNSSSASMTFATGSSERMRIDASGNLLMGTTTAAARLYVNESANKSESDAHFRIGGAGYSGFHWLDGTAYYIGQNSSARALRLYSGAETAGVALTNGSTSWGTFSDERLKYDVEPIENALESLSELRTVKYRLKNVDEPDSQKKLGVVAQDLVGVLDEVLDPIQISGDDTEYMAVRYTELVPVLIKAIQEQQETITALTARIEQLENN